MLFVRKIDKGDQVGDLFPGTYLKKRWFFGMGVEPRLVTSGNIFQSVIRSQMEGTNPEKKT